MAPGQTSADDASEESIEKREVVGGAAVWQAAAPASLAKTPVMVGAADGIPPWEFAHVPSADAIAAWVIGQHENGQRYRPLPADLRPRIWPPHRVQARLKPPGQRVAAPSPGIKSQCLEGHPGVKMDSPAPAVFSGMKSWPVRRPFRLAITPAWGWSLNWRCASARTWRPVTFQDADNVRGHVAAVAAMVDERNADYDHLDASWSPIMRGRRV